jgi:metal transporter CNNM
MTTFTFQQVLIWGGIFLCLSQSAMFSGLNLAYFGISRLRLEVEMAGGSRHAEKVLHLRQNTNYLLTTILWGNVGVNVLLTLLSDSVLAGVSAFFFSTFAITFFGEIIPQAYFSRHAMRMGAALSPILRFYQLLLFPLSKTTAMILDWWLGKEGIQLFRETEMRKVILKHVESPDSDIDQVEGIGALNFLAIDDISVAQEGEQIDPKSIISVPIRNGLPAFPDFKANPNDPLLQKVNASGKKWVVIVNHEGHPEFVLDSDAFLRNIIFERDKFSIYKYCYRPVIVNNPALQLGDAIKKLKVQSAHPSDDVIDQDVILLWAQEKRIITGSDILGRLLRGIVKYQRHRG